MLILIYFGLVNVIAYDHVVLTNVKSIHYGFCVRTYDFCVACSNDASLHFCADDEMILNRKMFSL